jgi:PKD repeat protein
MKNFTFLTACLFLMMQAVNAQQLNPDQVNREFVTVEIATGFWCGYCPGAALGADDLVENGHNVAIMENHNGDSLANVYSNGRNSYYGIGSFPTAKFDGILTVVGGSSSSSMYSSYLPKVNQRNGVMSDFTIDLQFTHNTDTEYTANIIVEKVGNYTGTNLKLRVAVTESFLDINWGLGEHVNFVNRLMVPNANGTSLNFSGGNTQTIELDFSMAGFWESENCELIAFIQDNSSKEVLQTAMKTMATPDFNLDAELYEVINIPETMCTGILEPEVTIKNKGADVLTSLNVNFEINGELVYTYPWTGNLSFTETDFFEIPEFVFSTEEENTINIFISDPNGGTDENPDNNSKTFETTIPVDVEDMLILIMKTDDNPEQTSWKVFDANGNVVDEGGPYTQAQLFFKDTVFYQSPGCHQFVMYDEAGNGLQTYYTLRSFINGTMSSFNSGGAFGYKEATHFNVLMEGINASFTMDENEGCEDLTVNFQDESFGDVTSWAWEFEGGDPATSDEQNPTVYYAAPGVYDVTLTVSDGTNTSSYTNTDCIEVFELPEVTFSEIDDMCVYWPAQELTTGSPAGGEYSGPGVDNGWFDPNVAGLGTHTLTYTYEDENGCENFAEQTVYVDECVGIDNPNQSFGLQIYPNPMTNSSIINFNLERNADVKISLFNNLGMEVMKITESYMNAGNQKINLNLSDFENGIYFIRIQAGAQIHTEKVTLVK